MAPPARLSTAGLVDGALGLVDRSGFDALSVSAVAGHLSVAPSAIYTYCDGLDGLRHLVAVAATENLAEDLRTAAIGAFGGDALDAMASAYRKFVLEHPGQFAATLRPPNVDDSSLVDANAAVLRVFELVFAAMGLDGARSRLAARSTHSAIHGFLAMEHVSGSTPDHADEYAHMIDALQRGLA